MNRSLFATSIVRRWYRGTMEDGVLLRTANGEGPNTFNSCSGVLFIGNSYITCKIMQAIRIPGSCKIIRNTFWKISKYQWRPSNQSMFSICLAYSVSFSPSVWWRWATNEFLMQLRWPKQPLVWRLLFFRRLGCSFCRATRSAAMLVPIGCLGCTPNSSTYTPTV